MYSQPFLPSLLSFLVRPVYVEIIHKINQMIQMRGTSCVVSMPPFGPNHLSAQVPIEYFSKNIQELIPGYNFQPLGPSPNPKQSQRSEWTRTSFLFPSRLGHGTKWAACNSSPAPPAIPGDSEPTAQSVVSTRSRCPPWWQGSLHCRAQALRY